MENDFCEMRYKCCFLFIKRGPIVLFWFQVNILCIINCYLIGGIHWIDWFLLNLRFWMMFSDRSEWSVLEFGDSGIGIWDLYQFKMGNIMWKFTIIIVVDFIVLCGCLRAVKVIGIRSRFRYFWALLNFAREITGLYFRIEIMRGKLHVWWGLFCGRFHYSMWLSQGCQSDRY